MCDTMAETETLGVIQQEIHEQARDEGPFTAVRGDLTMTMTQH
jgi:hypothetical protein